MTTVDPTAVSAAQPTISATSRPRLPLLNRATYGLGDFASGFVWTTVGSYLAIFYTDSVGIAAAVVGVLMLVARVLDAVVDPLIGALAERTRSRHGRFRPWVLYGMVPLAVLVVITFTAPFPGHSVAAVIYAGITYGLLGFLYSAVNVPYGAIAAVMAETPADRVSLNSFRFMGMNLNGFVLGLVTVPLVVLFSHSGDGHTETVGGYTITVALFALVSLPMFFAVFKTSRETITPVRSERVPLRATVRAAVTNPMLMVFLTATMLSLVAFFGRLGVVIYYYQYSVGHFGLIPVLMGIPAIAGVLGTLLFTRFARHIGKRTMLMIGLGAEALTLIALYLVGPHNVALVLGLTVVYGLASFSLAMLFSMIGDVIDYGEHKTGVRTDGSIYAIFSFSTKAASAIGAVGVGLLGGFGYVANATQTASAQHGINLVVNLLPALVDVVAILVLIGYRLTDREAAEIRNRLNAAAEAARDGGTAAV